MIKHLTVFILIAFCISCGSSPESGWPEKDMMEYGVPMTIKTPEDVSIEKTALGFQEDITVKNGNGFDLQIFVSEAMVKTEDAAIQSQKELVKESPYYLQMIQEDPAGFIFENKMDSTQSSFGFRYVKLMGGKEYLFQEGLMGLFSQEQAKAMYNAIQQ